VRGFRAFQKAKKDLGYNIAALCWIAAFLTVCTLTPAAFGQQERARVKAISPPPQEPISGQEPKEDAPTDEEIEKINRLIEDRKIGDPFSGS
jgi:hypothetical protein